MAKKTRVKSYPEYIRYGPDLPEGFGFTLKGNPGFLQKQIRGYLKFLSGRK